MPAEKTFLVEDTTIMFRNFAGAERPMNRAGDRNFCVPLDSTTAEQMYADGWNVKYTTPRDEGDEPTPYIQVAVGYKVRPPLIVLITSKGRTHLREEDVDVLDWTDIKSADVFCNGYDWEVGGKTGTKAYLKTMFVKIHEDPLEMKYGITAAAPEVDETE